MQVEESSRSLLITIFMYIFYWKKLAVQGEFRPRKIAVNPKVITESPPGHLTAARVNINTKDELRSHRSKAKKSFKM